MKLFVFIQHEEEKINSVSLEALQGAQEIAEKSSGTVSAITFSSSIGDQLTGYELNEILVIEYAKKTFDFSIPPLKNKSKLTCNTISRYYMSSDNHV